MLEGDVVVRINDKPTINMSHEDAHRELVAAGTQFVLGVLRFVIIYFHSQPATWFAFFHPCRGTNLLPEAEDEPSVEQNDVCLQKEQERIDKIISDASVTDEEIAELLSGEAEVLKGHNILGYDQIRDSLQSHSNNKFLPPQSQLSKNDAKSWCL